MLQSASPQFKNNWQYLKRVYNDSRTGEQIAEHYLLERSLAEKLRSAPGEGRLQLYGPLYDQLYASLPHHPRFTRRYDPSHAGGQVAILKHLVRPNGTFLEIGTGDGSVSFAMSSVCREVIALDVTERAILKKERPPNFRFVLSDGIHMPIESGTVDFAYSNQLMEHLHPEDAEEELREIFRILRPGGMYFCITPSSLTGPHDISRYFGHEACGFHLKEYSYHELEQLFGKIGFRGMRACFARGGRYGGSVPIALLTKIERVAAALPTGFRERLSTNRWVNTLLGLAVLAEKPLADS